MGKRMRQENDGREFVPSSRVIYLIDWINFFPPLVSIRTSTLDLDRSFPDSY